MNDSSFAQECVNTNGIGTLKLLEYAKKNAIKNFIYITGSNTYRQSDISVDEKFPQYPVNRATYYLSSKVLGEFYVKHFEEIGSINSTILRISSIYGNLIKKDFITNSIIKLIKGEKVFIYNADYKADFVYIQDVIKIIFSCIENAITGTFNISSNKLFSIREIIDIILHFLKDKNELIEYSSAVKIDMGYFLVNNELAKNILGYAPTNMNEAIKEIIFKVKSTIR
jgi:UDP-glucose 4-epimerase